MTNQKIIPHLWFDKQAVEAATFYTSVFKDATITHTSISSDTLPGDSDIIGFSIQGFRFMATNGWPSFKANPSISFFLNFDPSRDNNARTDLDDLWEKLAHDGNILMPLQKYPFSERYGWVQDKYGVSWQLILSDPAGEERPFIVPSLMFVGDRCGQAEEAINTYLSTFQKSKPGLIAHYDKGMAPDKEGTLMYGDFMLEEQWFAASDSAYEHKFAFNEAISLIVHCKDQNEIDYFWKTLSAEPEAEKFGWLKDKYGVSWQIIPENMHELMAKNPQKTTPTMLKMKKISIADLIKAGERNG